MEEKIKVFLVEDEYVVREGIKNKIDWEGNGYEFVGEAGDGEQAYARIKKLSPDIVITDIRMPFMDGLELTRLIRESLPDTSVIILSGFGEFEYAKEGIQLGVAEYLLKPINSDDLTAAINRVRDKVINDRQQKSLLRKYELEMGEGNPGERKEFFTYLVSENPRFTEVIEKAKVLSMDLTASVYNMILFKAYATNHEYDEYSKSVNAVNESVSSLEGRNDGRIRIFDRGLEGQVILCMGDSAEDLEKLMEEITSELSDICKTYDNVRYFGGIGCTVERVTELRTTFGRASHAFAHRYLSDKNMFLWDTDIENRDGAEEKTDNISLGDLTPGGFDKARIEVFLKTGNREETEIFIDEFLDSSGVDMMHSDLIRQYLIMDTFFCVQRFVEMLGKGKEEIPALESSDVLGFDKKQSRDYIVSIINKAIELREGVSNSRHKGAVEEAIRYMEENFADPDLSLNSVAAYSNFSPNYMSMVFAQETGQTFVKYLTDFRMNKAKELLRCTSKSGSDISYDVGYKDPHYFSYLFKRTQGMTPTQYRNGHVQDNK